MVKYCHVTQLWRIQRKYSRLVGEIAVRIYLRRKFPLITIIYHKKHVVISAELYV